MKITIDIPDELESEITSEAERRNLPLAAVVGSAIDQFFSAERCRRAVQAVLDIADGTGAAVDALEDLKANRANYELSGGAVRFTNFE